MTTILKGNGVLKTINVFASTEGVLEMSSKVSHCLAGQNTHTYFPLLYMQSPCETFTNWEGRNNSDAKQIRCLQINICWCMVAMSMRNITKQSFCLSTYFSLLWRSDCSQNVILFLFLAKCWLTCLFAELSHNFFNVLNPICI